MRRQGAGLVGLYRPDKVPARAQIRAGFDLAERFLQVVFAKIAQTGRPRRPHDLGRLRFTDRQQANRLPVAGVFFCRGAYLPQHLCYIAFNLALIHAAMVHVDTFHVAMVHVDMVAKLLRRPQATHSASTARTQ